MLNFLLEEAMGRNLSGKFKKINTQGVVSYGLESSAWFIY